MPDPEHNLNPGAQKELFDRPFSKYLLGKAYVEMSRDRIEEKLDRILELLEPKQSSLIIGNEAIQEFKKLK